MNKLKKLMYVSIAISIAILTVIYIRNYNNQGYIIMFDYIPLYKRDVSHNEWLTGTYLLIAMVSVSVLLGNVIYNIIINRTLIFNIKENKKLNIITTSLVLWYWLVNFIIILETSLYPRVTHFTSILGIKFEYWRDGEITKKLMVDYIPNLLLWFVIILVLVFINRKFINKKRG